MNMKRIIKKNNTKKQCLLRQVKKEKRLKPHYEYNNKKSYPTYKPIRKIAIRLTHRSIILYKLIK